MDEASKLMKSLMDFHDVTFNFYDQKVTETGKVVTSSNFSIRLFILFYV